jgi:hypothetical protein
MCTHEIDKKLLQNFIQEPRIRKKKTIWYTKVLLEGNFSKNKGKISPVLNQLSTASWRCMAE